MSLSRRHAALAATPVLQALAASLALAAAGACTSNPPAAGDAGPDAGQDAGPDAGAPDGGDAGSDAGTCTVGPPTCASISTVLTCGTGTPAYTNCLSGESCINGGCVGTCIDQCNLGDTDAGPDGGTLTCQLFDLGARGVVDAGPGMEDRSRLYNAYLRKWGLPDSQVAQLEFTGPDLSTLSSYNDVGDSALFTGTYLAAEAWRYEATQSPDALANVISLVNALHIAWNVSGSPGWLARFAVPANSGPLLTSQFSSSNSFDHFNGSYNGQTYLWKGNVSRDQYQGVVLGYSIAYDAISDEPTRELIRGDLVTFIQQLMMIRSLEPTINGIPSPVPIQTQYVVVTNQEPLSIVLTSNSNDDEFSGALLFSPEPFGVYPDPTVAIQLSAAFEIALQVTQGIASWQTQYQQILAFKEANIDSWLNIATDWVDTNSTCNGPYYGNNIAFEPMFNLARLESDPTRKAKIQSILAENMWSLGVEHDKQSWFAYIYAANIDAGSPDALDAISMGNQQLAEFTPPPRVHLPVTNNLPGLANCPGTAAQAIDLGARVISDFDWQRDPRQESDTGNPSEVYPGVDYLCAYWLARQEGFLPNDAPTRCTQWLP